MKETLEQFTYKDFLQQLDVPVKTLVMNLDASGVPLVQIANEIAAQPLVGMTTKGSNNWDNTIFQKVVQEIAQLVCRDGNELSQSLSREGNLTTQVIVAGASNLIGAKLGFAAALCTPFVILSFAVVLKAGLNVFCGEFNPPQ